MSYGSRDCFKWISNLSLPSLLSADPALSSDECITILRKQIQDLRKAYNTIKAELTVIDRRRKKLRRREREKKQHQLQSQQQGKICA